MKILQIGKFYPIRGGVEKVMYDIMTGLAEYGVKCDMLCAVNPDFKPGTIQLGPNARILCVPTVVKLAATMISPAMIIKLKKICAEYDIIHIHHPDPMACMALFFSGYKGKVVLHWHSDILKQKLLLKFYEPFQRWLINRADVIVGTTPVYVKESPFLQQVQHKTTHIPIGILPLQPDSVQAAQIKAQYAGKKIVFSLGRLVEYKGFCYLIEAASMLKEDCVILIGGTGPLRESLQKQVDEIGLNEKVILLGYISDDDLPAYFEACDLFVLSSIQKTEAFAIVQIEAMSCRTPVVATRIPESGVSWVNKHQVSGLNVEPGNAAEMASAISSILSDDDLYTRLSDGALKRFQNVFTRDMMTEKCVTLYNYMIV